MTSAVRILLYTLTIITFSILVRCDTDQFNDGKTDLYQFDAKDLWGEPVSVSLICLFTYSLT